VIAREALEALVPHKGAMCLWDEVVDWDAQRIALRTHRHRDRSHPLRSHDRLRAVHLCEYGAQAMAVHGGLRARAGGGSARPARVDDLPGALECEAEVLVEGEGSQQYAFHIRHAGLLLAEGRAAVMLQA